jgi:HD superfamily phosphohydrolase
MPPESPLKVVNDPVHGFISVSNPLILKLISHPIMQRLRRIKQLGVSDFVYPGALHTRFHHALGAMHLMEKALKTLRSKGHEISDTEFEAALAAILLHDIGHGPLSHVLENTILDVKHEKISCLLMQKINAELGGKLDLAVKIFKDEYERHFFHQLVSGQLDTDRLDYLLRDSFFTGVYEGKIGSERIIRMLDMRDDQIVVEKRAIYSVEHFLNARRLMYWQVYLYKTNVSAEEMLTQIIRRARFLLKNSKKIEASPAFLFFLTFNFSLKEFENKPEVIENFIKLDDYDIWACVKMWSEHEDKILSYLCKAVLNRDLFKTEMQEKPLDKQYVTSIKNIVSEKLGLSDDDLSYFVCEGSVSNAAYHSEKSIKILTRSGEILDITEASDLPHIKALTHVVKKFYISYPQSRSSVF